MTRRQFYISLILLTITAFYFLNWNNVSKASSHNAFIWGNDCVESSHGSGCTVTFEAGPVCRKEDGFICYPDGWTGFIWTSKGTSDDSSDSVEFSAYLSGSDFALAGTLVTHSPDWSDRVDYGPVVLRIGNTCWPHSYSPTESEPGNIIISAEWTVYYTSGESTVWTYTNDNFPSGYGPFNNWYHERLNYPDFDSYHCGCPDPRQQSCRASIKYLEPGSGEPTPSPSPTPQGSILKVEELEGFSPGEGLVTSNDGKISCKPTCEASYSATTTPTNVVLTAIPLPGSYFNSWGWCLDQPNGSMNGNVCSFTKENYDQTVRIFWGRYSNQPNLTAGSVTPVAATVGVPLTFSANVTNSGNAATGSSFNNFFQLSTSANGGNPSSSLISVNSRAALAAGESGAVISSSHTFASAGTYSVRVCADNNMSFAGTIAESNENDNCGTWTNVTVSAAPPPTTYTLTISPSPSGGTLTASGINCGDGGTDCSETYNPGTSVTINSNATAGYYISTWAGDCSGTAGTQCTQVMDRNRTVSANYLAYTSTIISPVPTNGYVTGQLYYSGSDYGQRISCGSGGRTTCSYTTQVPDPNYRMVLTATADSGYSPSASLWSGACSGQGNPCTLDTVVSHTTSANFTANPPASFTLNSPSPQCSGTSSNIALSWSTSSGASYYRLYRSATSSSGPWNQLGGGNLYSTSYTDGPMSPGTTYWYWVYAYNSYGERASNIVSTTAIYCTGDITVNSSPTGASYSLSRSGGGSASGTTNQTHTDLQVGDWTISNITAPSGYSVSSVTPGYTQTLSSGQTSKPTRTFTVNLSINQYALSLSKQGTGTGTVTSSPSGINCGTSCSSASANFNYGTSVTLTASPNTSTIPNSVFVGWGGACSGTGSCVVSMTQARSVTATFNLASPPTADIQAGGSDGPISIGYNTSTTISWTSNNATSCSVSPSGWTGTSGSQSSGNLASNRTYTLTCTGPGGSASDSVEVRILSVSLSASPNSGTAPLNNVSLTATISGASAGTYRYFFDCTNDGTNEQDTGDVSSNPYTASNLCSYPSAGSYTARVTAWHNRGTATGTVTINVSNPNPIVDLKMDSQDGPISITSGSNHTLSWTVSNATSCTASGGWSGNKSASGGSQGINNITSNTTYTLTCTGPGGSASDSVEVRILSVSLSASPNSGTAPLNNVSLTATISGASAGTYRYFFDCTNDGTNEQDTGDVSSNPYTASNLCSYPSAGSYTARVTAWHNRGTATGTATVSVSAGPPSVSNVKVTEPNYCSSGPAVTTTWDYSDPEGTPQSAYQVQIDDNNSFNSPEVDTGKVVSASRTYFGGQGILQFNTTYRARVRVWDSGDLPSNWVVMSICQGPGCAGNQQSWKTPKHAYPMVDFSWLPNPGRSNEPVNFTDGTTFYDSGGAGQRGWTWDFQTDGSIDSNQQNPSYTYTSMNTFAVTETVSDKDNFVCSRAKQIQVRRSIPVWKEVPAK